MDENRNWRLEPKVGLGELKFGMSRSQVDRFTSIYGASKGGAADRIPDDILHDTLAELGEGLTEEEKQEILEAYQESGPSSAAETEVRGDKDRLVLTYQSDHLVEILADRSTRLLKFDDKPVFEGSPIEVVRHIATILGESPVILKEEVAFPSNFVFLFEFLREAAGQPDGVAYVEGREVDRSIIWRSGPREGGVDLSLYKPVKL